jgi:squalene-hopene/tetraprenyl-beta-curcumene cyclase
MTVQVRPIAVLTTCLVIIATTGCTHLESKPVVADSWDQKAAATYLDQREGWWMQWPVAARGHGTFCISCHTALPYALSRPALRKSLGEFTPSEYERKLVDNVKKRVRLWKDIEPFYNDEGYDHKANESRGTEAVVNALVLAASDADAGKLNDDTRTAFSNMWALQQTAGEIKGAWLWLQFDLEPWEASDSQYYGATVAALAAGIAPENYRSMPQIQDHLQSLREYLYRQYSKQSTLNRLSLLWASTKWPGLLEPEEQKRIVNAVLEKQQTDGGWKLASLQWSSGSLFSLVRMWVREDGTPLESGSDGYATAFVTFVLQSAGLPRDNVHVQNGLSWLIRNQKRPDGFWPSYSLNKRREPSYASVHFMSDAATGFAVLALTANR